jgi:hypothetical protein
VHICASSRLSKCLTLASASDSAVLEKTTASMLPFACREPATGAIRCEWNSLPALGGPRASFSLKSSRARGCNAPTARTQRGLRRRRSRTWSHTHPAAWAQRPPPPTPPGSAARWAARSGSPHGARGTAACGRYPAHSRHGCSTGETPAGCATASGRTTRAPSASPRAVSSFTSPCVLDSWGVTAHEYPASVSAKASRPSAQSLTPLAFTAARAASAPVRTTGASRWRRDVPSFQSATDAAP